MFGGIQTYFDPGVNRKRRYDKANDWDYWQYCPSYYDQQHKKKRVTFATLENIKKNSSNNHENNIDNENDLDGSILYELTSEVEQQIMKSVIANEDNNAARIASVFSASLDKRKMKDKDNTIDITLDSGSDTHILTMEAARHLFDSKTSNLSVIGVSGSGKTAETEGKLIITITDGLKSYRVDLGTAYGLSGCS